MIAWLQLLRLPNVFTAAGDIVLGFAFVRGTLAPGEQFALLVVASACLYLAGMVLNDVFDLDQDERERPERPIPSGRIARSTAAGVGWGLLAVGVATAWGATVLTGDVRAGGVATGLAAMIVFYDAWAKRTVVGPLAMGGCRLLNVLLGMSLAPHPWQAVHLVLAGGLGLYIVGLTWFARREAATSHPLPLLLATLTMAAGIAVVGTFPLFDPPETVRPWHVPPNWYLMLGILGVVSLRRCLYAIANPEPVLVQAAVKQCLTSYLFFHAAVLLVAAGVGWALVALALLIPTLLLGRWIPRT